MFVLLAGFYLLFAGQVSMTETIAGLPAVLIAGGFWALQRRHRHRRLQYSGVPWPRVLLRPLAALGGDSLRLGAVLLRALFRGPAGAAGAVTRQPFRHGGGGAAAGRRALVTLAASLAPNGIVLDIDDKAGILSLHRLAPAPAQPDPMWPV